MNKESAYARRKRNKERRLRYETMQLSHARLIARLRDADPMKRAVAAVQLVNRGNAAVVRDGMKLCRDGDPKVREQAIWILGHLSFPDNDGDRSAEHDALALLRELAGNDPRARVRAEAQSALDYRSANGERLANTVVSEYERRKSDREYIAMWECEKLPHARLIEHLCGPDPIKRMVAVRELHVRNSKAALKDALKLCRSQDPVARERAALVLGQLTFPDDDSGRRTGAKVVDLLYELAVSDRRALVRAGAVCALGHRASRGGDHAIILKAVEKTSRDRSSAVRFYAACALGYLNLPGAEAVLPRLLLDKDEDVRNWAAFVVFLQEDEDSIVYDTPEVREALLKLTDDPNEEVRFEAFRSLGLLREKRAIPMLVRELENDDGIYFDLATAAGRLGDPVFIPILEEALESYGDDKWDSIKKALEQLRKNNP